MVKEEGTKVEISLKIRVEYTFLTTTDLQEILGNLSSIRKPLYKDLNRRRDPLTIKTVESGRSVWIDIVFPYIVAPFFTGVGGALTAEALKHIKEKLRKPVEETRGKYKQTMDEKRNITKIDFRFSVNDEEVLDFSWEETREGKRE